MRREALALSAFTLAAAAFVLPAPGLAQEPLQPETVTVETIPEGTRLALVADIAIGHIVDGRIHVVNADTMDYLGLIAAGFAAQMYVPEGGDEIILSTSYVEKISRGKRSDWLEIYDSRTLELKREIEISTKRAQALQYTPLLQMSADGRFMFVQNATPATSISVVDLQAGRQTGEVQNAGCYGVFPARDALKFSTICGDGTFGTYVLAADGSGAARKASAKLFDADADALFVHAVRDGDDFVFVSFQGDIYRVNLEGETASLVSKSGFAADGWRPSGYQQAAIHAASRTLFVLMHPGGVEGSHKNPGEEIWAVSLADGSVLSRSPTSTAFSITASQTEPPVLYAIDLVTANLIRYTTDPANGYAATPAGERKVGEAPIQVNLQ